MCASYWPLTNEKARQESAFHHLTQEQTENEGRSEITVLLHSVAKSSGLPWRSSSQSIPPHHGLMPYLVSSSLTVGTGMAQGFFPTSGPPVLPCLLPAPF